MLLHDDIDDETEGDGALIVDATISALRRLCDPYESTCWDIEYPVTLDEVLGAVATHDLEPPSADNFHAGFLQCDRDSHIRRIAWLVVHGWKDPIEVDVGIPELGCHVRWSVSDGNHRFAAAIARGDRTISASIGGSISYARGIGLFGEADADDARTPDW
jgi:hypothetical protein